MAKVTQMHRTNAWLAGDLSAGIDQRPAATAEPTTQAAMLHEHVAGFARELDTQDGDLIRLAGERLSESRRTRAALDECRTWGELVELQDRWSAARSRACLQEARWLFLYASLIRHPEWLTRQVRAARAKDDTRREP